MTFRNLKSIFPELFLMASVIYYWTLTSNLFNPIAVILLVVLVYQTISKNSIPGMLISSIFIVLNLFLVLALLSELSEFEVINQNYTDLLLFGSLYLSINLLVGGLMFFKYLRLKIN